MPEDTPRPQPAHRPPPTPAPRPQVNCEHAKQALAPFLTSHDPQMVAFGKAILHLLHCDA